MAEDPHVAPESASGDPAAAESRLYRTLLWGAAALGLGVRAVHTLAHDFPLNDGGLFYTMTRDLQAAHYALPSTTSYNAERIPYAYSPLGFYLAGLANDVLHMSLADVFRFLPLLAAALAVIAFALLARTLLAGRWAALAAVFCFALLPRSFIWLIMGGGLTRALSVVFALLALREIYLMYTRAERRHVALAAVWSGLTVLSHLETGSFLVWSAALLLLIYGRHERGVLSSLVLVMAAGAIAAPWFLTVVAEHGRAPFAAARETAATVFSGPNTRRALLLTIARFGLGTTQEPFFPVIAVLGALGALRCVSTGRVFLPAWWATTVLLDARSFPTYAAAPLALMAGIGVTEILWPVVRPRTAAGGGAAFPPWPPGWPDVRRWWTSLVLFAFLICYAAIGASTSDTRLDIEASTLVGLSLGERQAMAWVQSNAPPDARFLVVSASAWPLDRAAEWFPALAQRRSLDTVQGTEWLPNHTFATRQTAYSIVQSCANQSATCLQLWTQLGGEPFTHVYIPRDGPGQCCGALKSSLLSDPGYKQLYDGPGGTVFAIGAGKSP